MYRVWEYARPTPTSLKVAKKQYAYMNKNNGMRIPIERLQATVPKQVTKQNIPREIYQSKIRTRKTRERKIPIGASGANVTEPKICPQDRKPNFPSNRSKTKVSKRRSRTNFSKRKFPNGNSQANVKERKFPREHIRAKHPERKFRSQISPATIPK